MIWFPCADDCAPKNHWTCKEELRAHEAVPLPAPFSSLEQAQVRIRCSNCAGEVDIPKDEWKQACDDQDRRAARRHRAALTKYPRIEPQSGVLVNSRDDEKRVWKARGYHEAPHGVDESTFTEADYRIKERYKARTPGWRNLRRQA